MSAFSTAPPNGTVRSRGHREAPNQNPALKLKEMWAIRIRLQLAERVRDLAMFNLAIDSKLRACDLTALKVDDVAMGGRVRSRAVVVQQKTGRPVQFEITEQTQDRVGRWIQRAGLRPDGFLFPSRTCADRPITTRHYFGLVSGWVTSIGLAPSSYGTHSLRPTKAALLYRRTGNLHAVQLLLGHTRIENTVRYLGIEVEDALAISEELDI